MLWALRAPTLGDLGYAYGASEDEVVWHANEDYYQAGLEASVAPDLCGLTYLSSAHAWTGGYTYLHRDVPVFFDANPQSLAACNYAVGAPDEKLPAAWKRISVHDKFALFRRDGPCAPPPKDWNLDQL
jgi:hypothetical protein